MGCGHATLRSVVVAVVIAALGTSTAHARDADDAKDTVALARQFASPDTDVRDAALRALLLHEPGAVEKALATLEKDGAPAAEAARARDAWAIVTSLRASPRDSVAFWMLVERLLAPEYAPIERAVYLAAGVSLEDRATLLAERFRALATVIRFCQRPVMPAPPPRDTSDPPPAAPGASPAGEPPVIPTVPESAPSADPGEKELLAAGPRAVPHVLRLLAQDPWSMFTGLAGGLRTAGPAYPTEVSAAVVAAARLRAREAVPYLVFLSIGPSMTITSNAAAAVGVITLHQIATMTGERRADEKALFEWWGGERGTYADVTQIFVEAALAALLDGLPHLAQQPTWEMTFAAHDQPLGATFALLEKIGGHALGPVPTGTLEERLAGVRRVLATERARPREKPAR